MLDADVASGSFSDLLETQLGQVMALVKPQPSTCITLSFISTRV
jgi:hypothetical protein